MHFIDLHSQFRHLQQEITAAIDRVLRHGQFIMGPEVHELEERLADRVGVRHAVTCASGTDALLLALLAEGIGPGDAVITGAFSFFATAEVIAHVGATPVFVDIDPLTFNLDPRQVVLAIEAIRANDPAIHPLPVLPEGVARLRPRAMIPVDIFGAPADYDALLPVAAREGLFVLEDAAQSFGGHHRHCACGSLGHAGATSFFPAKPLGCYGDGGAVFTDDDGLAMKIRSLRNHGEGSGRYDNVRIGLNSRLDTLQAAILLQKLKIFSDELVSRQKIAERYGRLLADLQRQQVLDRCCSAWSQFSLLVDGRDAVCSALKEAGVPAMIYYPKGLHRQQAFQALGYDEGSFPITEDVCRRILSVPMHPYLDVRSQERICALVNEAAGARARSGGRPPNRREERVSGSPVPVGEQRMP